MTNGPLHSFMLDLLSCGQAPEIVDDNARGVSRHFPGLALSTTSSTASREGMDGSATTNSSASCRWESMPKKDKALRVDNRMRKPSREAPSAPAVTKDKSLTLKLPTRRNSGEGKNLTLKQPTRTSSFGESDSVNLVLEGVVKARRGYQLSHVRSSRAPMISSANATQRKRDVHEILDSAMGELRLNANVC